MIRDFARQDGMHAQTVLHEKSKAPQKTEVATSAAAEAPICLDLADAFNLPSRQTIGRIFRAYLDEVFLTPTELLHNAREMKRLADKGALLMNAVDQTARLQAPQGGEEGKARRDFLHRAWEQLWTRARNAAPEKTPKALSRPGRPVRRGHLLPGPRADRRDAARQARLDGQARPRSGLGGGGWSGPALALLDGLISDLLIPAEAIQDLLGFQPNLAAALAQMCDLAGGNAEEAKGAAESFPALNRLFAAGKLPEFQESLFGRVTRELRSTNPLSRNEPSQEFEAFISC